MQLIGDFVAGFIFLLLGYKLFVKFGWWAEKRGEKIIKEIKREPKNG